MLRNIMITGTAICLSMGSGLARADHDDALRYVVGGAILGAALGELAHASDHRGFVTVDYGYRFGYAYPYRPYLAYPTPRLFRPGAPLGRWDRRHGHGHRAVRDRRHRHDRYRR